MTICQLVLLLQGNVLWEEVEVLRRKDELNSLRLETKWSELAPYTYVWEKYEYNSTFFLTSYLRGYCRFSCDLQG